MLEGNEGGDTMFKNNLETQEMSAKHRLHLKICRLTDFPKASPAPPYLQTECLSQNYRISVHELVSMCLPRAWPSFVGCTASAPAKITTLSSLSRSLRTRTSRFLYIFPILVQKAVGEGLWVLKTSRGQRIGYFYNIHS